MIEKINTHKITQQAIEIWPSICVFLKNLNKYPDFTYVKSFILESLTVKTSIQD